MRTFKFGLAIQNTETLKAIEVLFIGSIAFSKILTQYPIMKMIEKDLKPISPKFQLADLSMIVKI